MVSINDVYRTTLAILNKEQRGYVSPDNFNYFAELAQRDIFEGYFSDTSHFAISQKGHRTSEGYGNMADNLREKIDVFSTSSTITSDSNIFSVPENFYRLNHLTYIADGKRRKVEQIRKDQLDYIYSSPLTSPSVTFPKFVRNDFNFEVYPEAIASLNLSYVRNPDIPHWGSAGGRVLQQDISTTVDFELHESEYYKLIYKILRLAGASTRESDIVQLADGLLSEEQQEEKS